MGESRRVLRRRRAATLALVSVVATSGCAALTGSRSSGHPEPLPETRPDLDAPMADAYRRGVREAVHQMIDGLGHDPRWTWVAPVVQEVWLPPQIVNGVYVPGHREWVLIQPGQWRVQFGLPLGPPPNAPSSPTPPGPPTGPPARAPRPGRS
jgi:hypothetical protein